MVKVNIPPIHLYICRSLRVRRFLISKITKRTISLVLCSYVIYFNDVIDHFDFHRSRGKFQSNVNSIEIPPYAYLTSWIEIKYWYQKLRPTPVLSSDSNDIREYSMLKEIAFLKLDEMLGKMFYLALFKLI